MVFIQQKKHVEPWQIDTGLGDKSGEIFLNFFNSATPFDALPMLEVDGVKVAQTLAILRYVARETGEPYQSIRSLPPPSSCC